MRASSSFPCKSLSIAVILIKDVLAINAAYFDRPDHLSFKPVAMRVLSPFGRYISPNGQHSTPAKVCTSYVLYTDAVYFQLTVTLQKAIHEGANDVIGRTQFWDHTPHRRCGSRTSCTFLFHRRIIGEVRGWLSLYWSVRGCGQLWRAGLLNDRGDLCSLIGQGPYAR